MLCPNISNTNLQLNQEMCVWILLSTQRDTDNEVSDREILLPVSISYTNTTNSVFSIDKVIIVISHLAGGNKFDLIY